VQNQIDDKLTDIQRPKSLITLVFVFHVEQDLKLEVGSSNFATSTDSFAT